MPAKPTSFGEQCLSNYTGVSNRKRVLLYLDRDSSNQCRLASDGFPKYRVKRSVIFWQDSTVKGGTCHEQKGYRFHMEEHCNEIYRRLKDYCNARAESLGVGLPIFEPVEVFARCCLDLRRDHLVSIEDDEQFVRACYLKIFDNFPSRSMEKLALVPLKLGVLSREEFIDRLVKSPEFIDKNTNFKLPCAEL